MANEAVVIKFELDAQGNIKGFKKLEDESAKSGKKSGERFSDGFENSLSGILKAGAKIAGVLTGVLGAVSFAKSIKAAQVQEDAINRLNSALLVSGNFTKEISQDFQNFASALQQQTKFGDEAILNQLALAKSFGATNDQAKQIVKTATDLSGAFGIDLESATRNVAKTLGGFAGELGETIPAIKNLTQEQLKAGQGIDLLASKFKGTAQEQIKTFSGALTQTGNIFSDLQEELGLVITRQPLVIKGIQALGVTFSKAIDSVKGFAATFDFFKDVIEPIFAFNRAFIDFVIAPFELFANIGDFVVKAVIQSLNGLVATLGIVGGKIGEFLGQFGVDNALTQGLQTFKESSTEVFQESAKAAQDSFQSILDFPLSQGLAEKNEVLLETIRATNEQIKAESAATTEALKTNVDAVAASTEQNTTTVGQFLKSFNVGFDNSAKNIAATSQALTQQFKAGLVKGIAGGIQTIVQAVANGENAFKAFGKFVLQTIGDLAIQLGQTLIASGLGIEALKTLGGGAAVAAGAALVAIGTLIKSFVGGGGGASAPSGGGNVGAVPASDNFTSPAITEPDDVEQRNVGPKVQLVVQGDVLDSDQTANRILDILNKNFDDAGASFNNASFA